VEKAPRFWPGGFFELKIESGGALPPASADATPLGEGGKGWGDGARLGGRFGF